MSFKRLHFFALKSVIIFDQNSTNCLNLISVKIRMKIPNIGMAANKFIELEWIFLKIAHDEPLDRNKHFEYGFFFKL